MHLFLVNYEALGQGIPKLRRGWLGEATIRMCVAELRGMAVAIETYRLHNWQQIPIVELRT